MLELDDLLNRLATESNGEFNVKLKFSISEPFISFFDTFYNYCDAKNIMEHGIQTVYDSAIWCTKGLSTNIGYYYPPDVEKRVLSAMTIRYLYSNIKCTVFKILYNLSLPSETVEDIEKSFPDSFDLSLPDFFSLVKTLLTKIHSFINDFSSENTLMF